MTGVNWSEWTRSSVSGEHDYLGRVVVGRFLQAPARGRRIRRRGRRRRRRRRWPHRAPVLPARASDRSLRGRERGGIAAWRTVANDRRVAWPHRFNGRSAGNADGWRRTGYQHKVCEPGRGRLTVLARAAAAWNAAYPTIPGRVISDCPPQTVEKLFVNSNRNSQRVATAMLDNQRRNRRLSGHVRRSIQPPGQNFDESGCIGPCRRWLLRDRRRHGLQRGQRGRRRSMHSKLRKDMSWSYHLRGTFRYFGGSTAAITTPAASFACIACRPYLRHKDIDGTFIA
jgi:hypothetical protein